MAKLIYSALASLDGYTVDAEGSFAWAAPDEEVHRFVNDLQRPVALDLYGRRMYDTMAVWETMDVAGEPDCMREFQQLWKATDKIVYSRTLGEVRTARTRLERQFEPDAVRALKATTAGDLSIGGPELAAQALRAGLVDKLQLILSAAVVGGGTKALPDGLRLDLDLLAERRFGNGCVFLHYAVR